MGKENYRKTLSVNKDTLERLNKKRFGGESWDAFFKRIEPSIPKREGE